MSYIAEWYLTTYLVHLDVANIENISKQDMVDFYELHMSPASPQRAKAAVWLVAQTTPEELAAASDPSEQINKLADAMGQMLTQVGIQYDAGKLQARLANSNAASGDVSNVKAGLGAYLKQDAGVPEADVEKLLADSDPVLKQILPAVGIVAQSAKDTSDAASTTSSERKLPTNKEAEVIEDVRDFKARMPLSEGARPSRDLVEFEDLEPKL